MKEKMIEVKSLFFRYKEREKLVLNNINLSIERGEIFGILGTNGAGKTTLLSILSTLQTSFSGALVISGFDVKKQPCQVRKLIGVLFQEPVLDESLSGFQNLDFYAKIYNVSDRKKHILKAADFIGIKNHLNKKVKYYSGGMKRRLEFARCFLLKPKVLILDEPTLGLDPVARRQITNYLKRINKDLKITIIISTHNPEEADCLCHRIAIINHGRIALVGSPTALKSKLHVNLVRIKAGLALNTIVDWLKEKDWVRNLVSEGSEIKFILFNPERNMNSLLNFISRHKVLSFGCSYLSLEDIFMNCVGGEIKC